MRIKHVIYTVLISLIVSYAQETAQWRILWDRNSDSSSVEYYWIYKGLSEESVVRFKKVPDSEDPSLEDINWHFDADTQYIELTDKEIQKGIWYYYKAKAFNAEDDSSEFSNTADKAYPKLDIPNRAFLCDSTVEFLFSDIIIDPDTPNGPFTWIIHDTNLVRINITDNSLEVFAQTECITGRDTVFFNVIDPDGFNDSDTAIFTILDTPPDSFTIDIPDQQINVGAEFNDIQLNNYIEDYEGPPGNIIWDVDDAQFLDVSIINNIAEISINDINWIGSETITFIAEDTTTGYSAEDAVVFTIQENIEVSVYPIPFIESDPEHDGIHFRNFEYNSKVIVYDLVGKPVSKFEIHSSDYVWPVRNNNDNEIRSGIYVYVVRDDDDKKIASGKLIIVR